MKIFTHMSVDLDAVCSVWAAKTFIPRAGSATVEFRPANWNGDGADENDLILDIDANGRGMKGRKEENGFVHSCFASMVMRYAPTEDQLALANIIRFVDVQDTYGSAVKYLLPEASPETKDVFAFTGVNAVLRALQSMNPGDDLGIVEKMSEILSGMLKTGHARQRAIVEARTVQILDGGKVAIKTNTREYGTDFVLFEEYGVRVVIYVDGYSIGLVRRSDEPLRMDHPAFQSVVEAAGETSEWFAHSAGFLYCRGSRKAPATSPSKVHPEQLAEVANKLLT